jgi:hypothetical protein
MKWVFIGGDLEWVLREKQYVDWHYNATDFIAKSKPAIYYLSLNGIRYLRNLNIYPSEELRKRYKEPTRKQVFIDRCLLVADCSIALQAKSDDKLRYTCILPADYVDPDNTKHFINELKPHLCFTKQQDDESTTYLLEYFEQTLPRYQLRMRLKDYVDYLANNGGQPITLFICANTADLLYVKRYAKKLIEENGDEALQIRITILDKIRTSGVTSMIWEEI